MRTGCLYRKHDDSKVKRPMLTPSSIDLVEPTLSTGRVNTIAELAKQIQICSQGQFTGRLDLNLQHHQNLQWSLLFRSGRLTWSASELHPIRRWSRHLFRHCPQLVGSFYGNRTDGSSGFHPSVFRGTHSTIQHRQCPDYGSLIELIKQGKIEQKHLAGIVAGMIAETLFDILQASHQLLHRLDMQVTYRQLPQDVLNSMLIVLPAALAWEQAQQTWEAWQQAGLAEFSPNLAPVIWDTEELRRQTSLFTYHNLSTLANGTWTLRDLAVKLNYPLLPLTQSILPFIRQGIMGLNQVGDISYFVESASGPLVAYIEDSRFDSATMKHILAQAGCRFIDIPDATQALPILLEQKPDLIFLDLLMPVANGYEICAQIRRISVFQETPIVIVTSSDGIVDRVRAKLMGSSGFLAKPIDPEKVLSVLQQYLPV